MTDSSMHLVPFSEISDGIWMCWHSWSPFARLTWVKLMELGIQKELGIRIVDLTDQDVDLIENKLGQKSNAWGELFRIKNGNVGGMKRVDLKVIKSSKDVIELLA